MCPRLILTYPRWRVWTQRVPTKVGHNAKTMASHLRWRSRRRRFRQGPTVQKNSPPLSLALLDPTHLPQSSQSRRPLTISLLPRNTIRNTSNSKFRQKSRIRDSPSAAVIPPNFPLSLTPLRLNTPVLVNPQPPGFIPPKVPQHLPTRATSV